MSIPKIAPYITSSLMFLTGCADTSNPASTPTTPVATSTAGMEIAAFLARADIEHGCSLHPVDILETSSWLDSKKSEKAREIFFDLPLPPIKGWDPKLCIKDFGAKLEWRKANDSETMSYQGPNLRRSLNLVRILPFFDHHINKGEGIEGDTKTHFTSEELMVLWRLIMLGSEDNLEGSKNSLKGLDLRERVLHFLSTNFNRYASSKEIIAEYDSQKVDLFKEDPDAGNLDAIEKNPDAGKPETIRENIGSKEGSDY